MRSWGSHGMAGVLLESGLLGHMLPGLTVLMAHGAHDSLGGCSMDADLARELSPPYRDALTVRCYRAGQAIYRDAPARALLAADLRMLARHASGDTQ